MKRSAGGLLSTKESIFKVAELEKQVTQTKAQEMAYSETTNHTFKIWNETC